MGHSGQQKADGKKIRVMRKAEDEETDCMSAKKIVDIAVIYF